MSTKYTTFTVIPSGNSLICEWLLAQYVFLVDKFIGSVIGKDAIQQDKYIAMVTAKYSQMYSEQQVI